MGRSFPHSDLSPRTSGRMRSRFSVVNRDTRQPPSCLPKQVSAPLSRLLRSGSMKITSDLSGIDKLIAQVRKARERLPELLQERGEEIGQQVVDALKAGAPKGRSGGGSPQGDEPG